MTGKQYRTVLRYLHLFWGVVVAAYIYLPLRDDPIFTLVVQYIAIPALVIGGALMWQQPAVLKFIHRSKTPMA